MNPWETYEALRVYYMLPVSLDQPEFTYERTEVGCQYDVKAIRDARRYADRLQLENDASVIFEAINDDNEAFFDYLRNVVEVWRWPQPVDEFGQTALMYAATRGSGYITDSLIALSFDVNSRSKAGWTALMYAAKFGASLEIAEALVRAGADALVQNQDDETALQIAIKYGSPIVSEFAAIDSTARAARQEAEKLRATAPPPAWEASRQYAQMFLQQMQAYNAEFPPDSAFRYEVEMGCGLLTGREDECFVIRRTRSVLDGVISVGVFYHEALELLARVDMWDANSTYKTELDRGTCVVRWNSDSRLHVDWYVRDGRMRFYYVNRPLGQHLSDSNPPPNAIPLSGSCP